VSDRVTYLKPDAIRALDLLDSSTDGGRLTVWWNARQVSRVIEGNNATALLDDLIELGLVERRTTGYCITAAGRVARIRISGTVRS
jgi:hypothetical protein